MARIEKVEGKTIHNIDLTSGSTITLEQYLMLRVIRKDRKVVGFKPEEFGLKEWNRRAAATLKGYSSWKSYIENFSVKLQEGTFALPLFYQRQIAAIPTDSKLRPNVAVSPIARRTRSHTKDIERGVKKHLDFTSTNPPRTPSPEAENEYDDTESSEEDDTPPDERSYRPTELLDLNFPKTKDEQIVNTALIDFLNAFTIQINTYCHWTLYRKPFKMNFKNASFEARTDGVLEDSNSKTYALVEVKPMSRYTKDDRIAMQEAAEIVSWIKCEPDSDGFLSDCGNRVLVSQDRHEIYLTFAEYNANYVKYLNSTMGGNERREFLTLHAFGPWKITRVSDMQSLGSILLAIAMRAEDRHKRDQRTT